MSSAEAEAESAADPELLDGSGVEGAARRHVTRIAGTVLKYYRCLRGVPQKELAEERIVPDEYTLSRAESGKPGPGFFRENVGNIGRYLELRGSQIVVLLNALWVDEVLAYLVFLTRRSPDDQKRSCFALLQWLWYQPEARSWLKVLFFSNQPPTTPSSYPTDGSCLERHPAFQRGGKATDPHVVSAHDRSTGGASTESPDDVLRRSLFIGNGSARLIQAIRGAQVEALAALEKPGRDGLARLGEMLLLFADLAKQDPVHGDALASALTKLQNLSPVDRRYRARALYLLGEPRALCGEVRAAHAADRRERAVTLAYYADQAGDERDGTLTLQGLYSHLKFAREKKSAPLLALYLKTTCDLITAKDVLGWSTAFANLNTTRRIRSLTRWTLYEFHKGSKKVDDRGAKWADHKCAFDEDPPTCQQRAEEAAGLITGAIAKASSVIGFFGPH